MMRNGSTSSWSNRSRAERGWRLAALALLVALGPGAASAHRDDYTKNDWPVQVVLRPLTLAKGMWEIRGDTLPIVIDTTGGADGSGGTQVSVTLAPNLYRGITRRLTVGLIHEQGFCLDDNDCGSIYNDAAIEASYALLSRGNVQLALRLGPQAPRFSRFFFGLRSGITTRIRTGRFAFVAAPTLYVGLVGRDDRVPDTDDIPADYLGRGEILLAPVAAQLQVTSRLMMALTTGVNAPLGGGLTGRMQVPLGLEAVVAINFKVDFGAEVKFVNLLGGDETEPAGIDRFAIILRAALRY